MVGDIGGGVGEPGDSRCGVVGDRSLGRETTGGVEALLRAFAICSRERHAEFEMRPRHRGFEAKCALDRRLDRGRIAEESLRARLGQLRLGGEAAGLQRFVRLIARLIFLFGGDEELGVDREDARANFSVDRRRGLRLAVGNGLDEGVDLFWQARAFLLVASGDGDLGETHARAQIVLVPLARRLVERLGPGEIALSQQSIGQVEARVGVARAQPLEVGPGLTHLAAEGEELHRGQLHRRIFAVGLARPRQGTSGGVEIALEEFEAQVGEQDLGVGLVVEHRVKRAFRRRQIAEEEERLDERQARFQMKGIDLQGAVELLARLVHLPAEQLMPTEDTAALVVAQILGDGGHERGVRFLFPSLPQEEPPCRRLSQ